MKNVTQIIYYIKQSRFYSRIATSTIILGLLFGKNFFAEVQMPGVANSSGVYDLGHYYVPSLMSLVGEDQGKVIWWVGTLILQLIYLSFAINAMLRLSQIRLAICLYVALFLHWLCWHASVFAPPDNIIWEFPKNFLSLENQFSKDLWFSNHTASAMLIFLATKGHGVFLRLITLLYLAFNIILILSARVHYSVDILGGLFVAYTIHDISVRVTERYFNNAQ